MVLQDVKTNAAWIQMSWKCSYVMRWPNMLYVAQAMLNAFDKPEVIIGDVGAGGESINPATNPPEKGLLVLRGYSKHFKGKISLRFSTNTNDVVVNLPRSLNLPEDYESLSKTCGLFMDTIELRMFAAGK